MATRQIRRPGGSRRIFIVGDVGGESTFHLGDEAMLQANLQRLREWCPGCELTVASRDPEWTALQYGVESVPRPELSMALAGGEDDRLLDRLLGEARRALGDSGETGGAAIPSPTVRALARSDALLVSGGGNLNGSWPDQLYERALLMELGRELGLATAVTGQTLGPHLGATQRTVLRRALARAGLVGVRETYSLRVARLLGVAPERAELHVDDAFFQPRAGAGTGAPAGWTPADRPWIAVTVTRYSGPLAPLAEQLGRVAVETGCRLVFVPHVKQPEDDLEVARALAELLPDEVEAELLPVPSVEEGRWISENAALVVSMRYHPVVFAVAGGVPALAVYVDEYTRVKLRGALGHAGLEEWALPVATALAGTLADAVLDLARQREAVRDHLAREHDRWAAMERRHGVRLARALGVEPPADQDGLGPGADAPAGAAPGTAPRPQGRWSELARAQERRADSWFEDRLGLLEQVDSAVEYALSLEATLKARDREIEGLKRALEAGRPESAEDSGTDGET